MCPCKTKSYQSANLEWNLWMWWGVWGECVQCWVLEGCHKCVQVVLLFLPQNLLLSVSSWSKCVVLLFKGSPILLTSIFVLYILSVCKHKLLIMNNQYTVCKHKLLIMNNQYTLYIIWCMFNYVAIMPCVKNSQILGSIGDFLLSLKNIFI